MGSGKLVLKMVGAGISWKWEIGPRNRWYWYWDLCHTPFNVFLDLQSCNSGMIFHQLGCRLVLKRINYSNITGVFPVMLRYNYSYISICSFWINNQVVAVVIWWVALLLLCYVMLCYVMLCYVMLCYVMLCYASEASRVTSDWLY